MKDTETLLGLHELLTYGLKGMAAYAHHAGPFTQTPVQLLISE